MKMGAVYITIIMFIAYVLFFIIHITHEINSTISSSQTLVLNFLLRYLARFLKRNISCWCWFLPQLKWIHYEIMHCTMRTQHKHENQTVCASQNRKSIIYLILCWCQMGEAKWMPGFFVFSFTNSVNTPFKIIMH